MGLDSADKEEPSKCVDANNIRSCGHIKRCGVILVLHNEKTPEPKILQVKHRQFPHYWGFPKGSMENGESEIETAIRETKEETNISLTNEQVKKAHRIKYQYHVYFLVIIDSKPDVIIDRKELTQYAWVDGTTINSRGVDQSKYTVNAWKKAKLHIPRYLDVFLYRSTKNGKEIMVEIDTGCQIPQVTVVGDNSNYMSIVANKFGVSSNSSYKVNRNGPIHKIWIDVTYHKEFSTIMKKEKLQSFLLST